MELKPIKRTSISEQVFDQLKSQIVSGKWEQGEKIPSESELSQTFGVSRVTVRQALQKLTVLGLIETKTGEGSYVTSNLGSMMNTMVPVAYFGKKDVYQVLEFRKVIETESAGLAATKATDDDIMELKSIQRRMERATANKEKFAGLDLEFHFKIAEMTRNDLIISTQTILKDILSVAMQDVVEVLGHEVGIFYHQKLIDAIAAHDYALTRQLMCEHVDETVGRLHKAGKL